MNVISVYFRLPRASLIIIFIRVSENVIIITNDDALAGPAHYQSAGKLKLVGRIISPESHC